MTLEISPVLAGTYDAPDYAAANNIASTPSSAQASDSSAVAGTSDADNRRYTKFDHSATDAGTMTDFSFGDFVDMINPLQHIPLVSSVYREITGDTINPVSRIVGNIMYGGVLGVASAVIGGLGGGGDDIIQEESGKDSIGGVIASLFGSDNPATPAATTQLAQNDDASQISGATPTTPAATQPAFSTPPARAQLASLAPPISDVTTPLDAATVKAALQPTQSGQQATALAQLQSALAASSKSAAIAAAMPGSKGSQSTMPAGALGPNTKGAMDGAGLLPLNVAKSFVLDPNKLPYGGVMDPAQTGGAQNPAQQNAAQEGKALQGNNMAVAVANSAPGVAQMNHTIYAARKLNPLRPPGYVVPSVASTTPSTPTTSTSNQAVASSTPPVSATDDTPMTLPPALMSDIAALRAINQYRSTASQNAPSGTSVDVMN